MVGGCGCHDPIVFGHDWFCELGLGPTAHVPYWARRSDFRPEPIPIIVAPAIPYKPEHHMTAAKNARRALAEQTLAILRAKLAGNRQ